MPNQFTHILFRPTHINRIISLVQFPSIDQILINMTIYNMCIKFIPINKGIIYLFYGQQERSQL